MHTFNDQSTVAPANVPEYLSLSLERQISREPVTKCGCFLQGGDCSVSPHMYIMYILYVCVYHEMKDICLHVCCTLFGIERQYYVA